MLMIEDWPQIKKAYEDAITEVRGEKKMKIPERMRDVMGEYGLVNGSGDVTLPFVQVWESFMPLLGYHHVLSEGSSYSCPHTEGGEVERVLVLINEGGCNSAAICLDCLMEWVERNRSRIWVAADD